MQLVNFLIALLIRQDFLHPTELIALIVKRLLYMVYSRVGSHLERTQK